MNRLTLDDDPDDDLDEDDEDEDRDEDGEDDDDDEDDEEGETWQVRQPALFAPEDSRQLTSESELA